MRTTVTLDDESAEWLMRETGERTPAVAIRAYVEGHALWGRIQEVVAQLPPTPPGEKSPGDRLDEANRLEWAEWETG